MNRVVSCRHFKRHLEQKPLKHSLSWGTSPIKLVYCSPGSLTTWMNLMNLTNSFGWTSPRFSQRYSFTQAGTLAQYLLQRTMQKEVFFKSMSSKYVYQVCSFRLSVNASDLPATPKGLLRPDVSFFVLLSRSSMRPTLTIWHTKLILSLFKSSLPKS